MHEPGPLENPLANWPNDDLLFDPGQRTFIESMHPKLIHIFDWPELRHAFSAHNARASTFRRRSRTLGKVAVGLGWLSLLLVALEPSINLLMKDNANEALVAKIVGGGALFLAFASGVLGYSQIMSGRNKLRWLTHRFWTERMRQLHFQLIANNVPLALQTMNDADARRAWSRIRESELHRVLHRMEPIAEAVQRMEEDLPCADPWLSEEWVESGPAPSAGAHADADEFFHVLREQRFGIQRRYAKFKLRPGIYSPKSRAMITGCIGDLFTLLVLFCALIAGVIRAFGPEATHGSVPPAFIYAVSFMGCLTASIVAMRVLNEGLKFRDESERYEWYLAAVSAIENRYLEADPVGKVAALRDMECLSYQEMRQFIMSFKSARFVM